ncbi:rhoptry protein ROP10 [Toxoplasma gondii RUB]|uniref:Rhoptry protein ROP10 n=1 Tax=Toxoplasma gondii RUB TaxID=935652 RepID=A0A086MBS3_TOXGO|nr:rhoptry protein ROP10 [Toxoplasma gondii RUB]
MGRPRWPLPSMFFLSLLCVSEKRFSVSGLHLRFRESPQWDSLLPLQDRRAVQPSSRWDPSLTLEAHAPQRIGTSDAGDDDLFLDATQQVYRGDPVLETSSLPPAALPVRPVSSKTEDGFSGSREEESDGGVPTGSDQGEVWRSSSLVDVSSPGDRGGEEQESSAQAKGEADTKDEAEKSEDQSQSSTADPNTPTAQGTDASESGEDSGSDTMGDSEVTDIPVDPLNSGPETASSGETGQRIGAESGAQPSAEASQDSAAASETIPAADATSPTDLPGTLAGATVADDSRQEATTDGLEKSPGEPKEVDVFNPPLATKSDVAPLSVSTIRAQAAPDTEANIGAEVATGNEGAPEVEEATEDVAGTGADMSTGTDAATEDVAGTGADMSTGTDAATEDVAGTGADMVPGAEPGTENEASTGAEGATETDEQVPLKTEAQGSAGSSPTQGHASHSVEETGRFSVIPFEFGSSPRLRRWTTQFLIRGKDLFNLMQKSNIAKQAEKGAKNLRSSMEILHNTTSFFNAFRAQQRSKEAQSKNVQLSVTSVPTDQPEEQNATTQEGSTASPEEAAREAAEAIGTPVSTEDAPN